jgi:hypothetical protein
MNDWAGFLALGALIISFINVLTRSFDKSLSIREHEAHRDAVQRDIHRVENRLGHLEQTRPTTGELEILAEALNKRMDELRRDTTR